MSRATMDEKVFAIILANQVLDRPNFDPDDDECVLARQFLRALEREDTHINSLIPESLEITMRSRDAADRTDAIRQVLTFDQIKNSKFKVVELILQEMFGKIVTAPVLKKVIES